LQSVLLSLVYNSGASFSAIVKAVPAIEEVVLSSVPYCSSHRRLD
jgi:hypothetical protein